MIKYFLQLITCVISFAILVGIPYAIVNLTGSNSGWDFLLVSWLPAIIVFFVLTARIDEIE